MKAFILAGGKGSRLDPITQVIPKPLLMVGNKTCLEWVVDNLRANDITDIQIIKDYSTKGTAGVLFDYEVSDPFLVCNGDTITNVNIKNMDNPLVDAVIYTKDSLQHNGGTYVFKKKVLDKIVPPMEIKDLLEQIESYQLYNAKDDYYYDIGSFEKLDMARELFK